MQNRRNNRRKDDPTRVWENQTAWRTVSKTFKQRNPICQAIKYGQQCNKWATQTHHLIDPSVRPDLRTDWSNLVSCCDRHHVPGPGDSGLFQWAPTIGFNGEVYEHRDVILGPHASKRAQQRIPLAPGKLFLAQTTGKVDEALGTQAEIDDLLSSL
jgi:hypothetical protein